QRARAPLLHRKGSRARDPPPDRGRHTVGGRVKAVILAAGRGGRLSEGTGPLPEGPARVGAATLIEHQLATLLDAGIVDVTVVAGCRLPDVRRVCGPRVTIVNNVRFASTNSLYSLWLVRDLLGDGFLVLNCDVLFHPQLLDDL